MSQEPKGNLWECPKIECLWLWKQKQKWNESSNVRNFLRISLMQNTPRVVSRVKLEEKGSV